MSNKRLSIFGSTGSIGTQCLEVVNQSDNFEIFALTTNSNFDLLDKQCLLFRPKVVVLTNYDAYTIFKNNTSFKGEILYGKDELVNVASSKEANLLVNSLVGFSGVLPTMSAIENGIDVALANKETLVSAGSIVNQACINNNVKLFAIDSEHSAILQCLTGENLDEVEKLILTASGGPFRQFTLDQLQNVTLEQALKHPNWTMGAKITIDSSTLMNKGLEVIEAHWLFNVDYDKIEVIVHPQSIIHSMVQFQDGSIKAQLGVPDMKVPIAYALNYPEHKKYNFDRLDFVKLSNLEFEQPDVSRFPCLDLAYQAANKGTGATCVLNAANEIAVDLFLKNKIEYLTIPKLIEKSLDQLSDNEPLDLNGIVELDKLTRIRTLENGNS